MAVVGHGAGEDEDLHGRFEVLQHEGGHEVAPLGVPALERRDDAGDCPHLAVAQLAELRQRAVRVLGQRGLGAHQRMVADVEAQHLLFEHEQL